MYGYNGKALAIFFRSGNSTFAPSGWFVHAWSHMYITMSLVVLHLSHLFSDDANAAFNETCEYRMSKNYTYSVRVLYVGF